MDYAYDEVTAANLPTHDTDPADKGKGKAVETGALLPAELSDAYKSISTSSWGTRFTSFLDTARKQGESYYDSTRKEYNNVSERAAKEFTDLRSNLVTRSRALSLGSRNDPPQQVDSIDETLAAASEDSSTPTDSGTPKVRSVQIESEDSLVARIRAGAAKGLTEIEKAENIADAYLIRFGSTIGNVLKDAVSISAPKEGDEAGGRVEKDVLFELGETKKPAFLTRFESQLDDLHKSLESFKSDPTVQNFVIWASSFNAEQKTGEIAAHLNQYPTLRKTMEALVPDTVQYSDFWRRYYFYRSLLEAEEARRKDLLKGALEDEDVTWDEDDEDEETSNVNPAASSAETLLAPKAQAKTGRARTKSTDQDSDTSYDIVSGAPSGAPSAAPGSPPKAVGKGDESDDDWE